MTFLPGLYDIHAHLADTRLQEHRDSILKECQNNLQGVLANAAHISEWPEIIRMARQPGIYGALGCHPFFCREWQENTLSELEQSIRTARANGSKIIACGEIGLDFWNGREDAGLQRQIFSQQLLLARELSLPVILHNRKAWPDFFALLRELRFDTLPGVCHHFNASREIARQALDCGLFLSFCGPLTYPEARKLHDLARYVPLDRLLLETDCPDLPPQSKRGSLSTPQDVAETTVFLARLRGCTPELLAAQQARNWQTLFPDC
ncbi:MAG: TatD family hydrolase [Lentisphaerae bacterium]|nr:TatD family hydrolase [Lentisphaerota bacterium]